MAHFTMLPTEVLDIICRYLHRTDMASIARCNTALVPVARSHLYRSLELRDGHGLHSLARLLQCEPGLARQVNSIKHRITERKFMQSNGTLPSEENALSGANEAEVDSLLASILSILSNLESVDFIFRAIRVPDEGFADGTPDGTAPARERSVNDSDPLDDSDAADGYSIVVPDFDDSPEYACRLEKSTVWKVLQNCSAKCRPGCLPPSAKVKSLTIEGETVWRTSEDYEEDDDGRGPWLVPGSGDLKWYKPLRIERVMHLARSYKNLQKLRLASGCLGLPPYETFRPNTFPGLSSLELDSVSFPYYDYSSLHSLLTAVRPLERLALRLDRTIWCDTHNPGAVERGVIELPELYEALSPLANTLKELCLTSNPPSTVPAATQPNHTRLSEALPQLRRLVLDISLTHYWHCDTDDISLHEATRLVGWKQALPGMLEELRLVGLPCASSVALKDIKEAMDERQTFLPHWVLLVIEEPVFMIQDRWEDEDRDAMKELVVAGKNSGVGTLILAVGEHDDLYCLDATSGELKRDWEGLEITKF